MIKLIKTKTFWSGIALIVYGAMLLHENPEEGVKAILEGFAIIFIRDAILKWQT